MTRYLQEFWLEVWYLIPGPLVDDPLVPANFFDGWTRRVLGVFVRSFIRLAILQMAPMVLFTLIEIRFGGRNAGSAPSGSAAGLFLGIFLAVASTALVYCASAYVVIRDAATNRPTSLVEALRFAVGRVLSLVGWGAVVFILMFAGTMLVLPGLYMLIVLFSVFLGVIVVERRGLGRCCALVNRDLLLAVLRVLVALLVYFIYMLAAGVIGFLITGAPDVIKFIIGIVLVAPLQVWVVAVAIVTYAELRSHEPGGISTAALDTELTRA